MISDGATKLKWPYKLEMITADIIGWPAYLYLKLRALANDPPSRLGIKLWPIQFLGYAMGFKVFDLGPASQGAKTGLLKR